MCFDSASDNYIIHEFLAPTYVAPIIDVNCRRKDKNPYASFESLNKDGLPICSNGAEMVYNSYEAKKCHHKYHCPPTRGKITDFPHKEECCPGRSTVKFAIYTGINVQSDTQIKISN